MVNAQIEVNGPNAHPLYTYLKNNLPKARTSGIRGEIEDIGWNFYKFLVDHNGRPFRVYDRLFNEQWKGYLEQDLQ